MHHSTVQWPQDKQALYALLCDQMKALSESCSAPLSALANASALLFEALDQINWAGFYLCKGETLYLGPFQGKVACTLIPFGRGVCGTAAREKALQLVPDVHQFPGHIACDSASNAEIVVPLAAGGRLIGVLDIDSPVFNRFDEQDAEGLTRFCQMLAENVDWSSGWL